MGSDMNGSLTNPVINSDGFSIIVPGRFELFPKYKYKHFTKNFIQIEQESLDEITRKIASYIHSIGIKKNTIVPMYCDNPFYIILLSLSLWKLKAVPFPINNRLTPDEISDLLSRIESSIVFVENEIDGLKKSINQISIRKVISEPTQTINEKNFDIELEQTALILSTSGSEGQAKLVPLTFNNLFQSFILSNSILKGNKEDKWLLSLPLYHIGGFSIFTRSLFSNSKLIIPASLNTDDLVSTITETDPDKFSLVSTQFKRLIEEGIKPNSGLKYLLLGGGPLDSDLIKNAILDGWKICKVYGSTETSAFISLLTPENFNEKIESAGSPLPGVEIKILDECKNPLPPLSVGEIAISSPTVTHGYLNAHEINQMKFQNGFYYSGDYGYLDEDGYLYISNRRNDLIISGGENINSFEIEKLLLTHPLIADAVVVGIPDDEWGEIVVAVIVLKAEKTLTEENIKTFLKEKMASYKVPKRITFTSEIPKTTLGKVRKDEVKKCLQKMML